MTNDITALVQRMKDAAENANQDEWMAGGNVRNCDRSIQHP